MVDFEGLDIYQNDDRRTEKMKSIVLGVNFLIFCVAEKYPSVYNKRFELSDILILVNYPQTVIWDRYFIRPKTQCRYSEMH